MSGNAPPPATLASTIEQTALIPKLAETSPVLEEAVANAIALWADSSTDAESQRFGDLVRIKTKAVKAFFGRAGKSAHEITAMDVKAWRGEMEEQGLAAATIYARLSFLSSFFSWLMADPVLGQGLLTNPVRLARPKAPKAYQTESAKALSDEQLEKLKAVIRARADRGEIAARRDYAHCLPRGSSGMT